MRGAVSFSADPDTGVCVGEQFVAYQREMGITRVKVPIRTARAGTLPTSPYVQAVKAYQAAGIDVLPLFDRAFAPVGGETQGIFPNAPLNGSGNTLTSDWIDGWTLRATGFLRQLHKQCGIARAVAWNEASGMALLAPGVDPDPLGLKANALAPAVFGALAWQAAHRWRGVGIAEVYGGLANVAPSGGQDATNPYAGGFLDHAYAALAARGCKPPWPWRGWCLTAEGWWSADHLAGAIATIRAVMAKHGDTGDLIIGEWGGTCHDLIDHPAQAEPTWAAWQATGLETYFFSAPGHIPYLGDPAQYGSWGAFQWRNESNHFVATHDYAWGPTLRKFFAT